MLQLMGILGTVLTAMTIAVTTEIPLVALCFGAVAIASIVAVGIVITRSDRQ